MKVRRRRPHELRVITLAVLVLASATGFLAASAANPALPPSRQTAAAPSPAKQPNVDVRQFEPGQAIEREIERGQEHIYRIALQAGQFMRVRIDPTGIDLAMVLTAPGQTPDKPLLRLNRVRSREQESLLLEADASGEYRLSARAPADGTPSGSYVLRLEVRAPTAQDRQRMIADRLMTEAGPLLGQGSTADRAVETLERALVLWRELADPYWEGETLYLLSRAHYRASRQEKAVEYAEQALAVYRASGNRAAEGSTLNNLGIAYNNLSRSDRAVESLNQAVAIARELKEPAEEGSALINLGIAYNFLSRYETAIEHLNRAAVIFRELKNRAVEASVLGTLGTSYRSLDRYEQAIEVLDQSLAIYREVKDRVNEPNTLANLAIVYHVLGRYEKAIEYYDEALAIHREVKNRTGEGIVLHNQGMAYLALNRPETAIALFDQSLPIAREVKRRVGEGNSLANLGDAHRALKRYEKALEYYEQALPISREVKNREGEGSLLNTIGVVHHSLGRNEAAIEYSEQALAIAREVKARANEATALRSLAKAERDRGNLTRARTLLEGSLEIVESLRADIFNQTLRASYFASVQESNALRTDLLMRLHKANPADGFDALALESSERARARGLIELLTEAGADIRQGVDPSLIERERTLGRQLNAKAAAQVQMLRASPAPEQAAALKREIVQLEDEYEQVQARIRRTSPRYAAITQPEPLNVAQIQRQVLDSDTLLLEYALGEDRSYLWAVTSSSLSSYELPKQEDIEAAAREVVDLLNARGAGVAGESAGQRNRRVADADGRLPKAAGGLSRMVLGPVASLLGDKRLVVVADGALQYVPFSMLPTPAGAVADDRSNRAAVPLVVHHEIVSLPSASTMGVMRKELASRQPARQAIAVFADPVFSASDERLTKVTVTTKQEKQSPTRADDETRILAHLVGAPVDSKVAASRLAVPRLPFTRQEADRILAVASRATNFKALDFDASKSAVTGTALRNYRYVHFATHGYLDSERPGLSALVLSMVDRQGEPQDGFLRANEIYNLSLPAELVVLSACQTGLGKQIKGEGLVGLTRGFMYAGAARVVVSLWNVSDKATAELMAKFYEKMLIDGQRPAAALRAAQVDMWRQRQWEPPYYWAAFTLQGEWK